MKFVTYAVDDKAHYGVVKDETSVIDLSTRLPYADIVSFIAAQALPEVERLVKSENPNYELKELTLLPVVPNPGKIVCIGINYEDHRLEAGRDRTENPMVFGRWPESQTAHLQPIMRARVSTQLDYEGELLVVIGKRIPRYTKKENALSYVFGYSCYNEACNRDFQFHTRQLMPGKNFEGTGASGPWLVTADEIPDPQSLKLQMRLNGVVMQDANTKDMVWPIPVLIEYITKWLPLNPGDLIVSGTPGGVGFKRNPPVFMKNGDIAEVEIEKIGILRNTIKDEA